jgi:Spy/CpxP family protein refolding chaperone
MFRRNSFILAALVGFVLCGFASAQGWDGPGHDNGQMGFGGPPMVRAFHDRRFGRWWNDPMLAQKLNISADQKEKMDGIYEQYKLHLIDLNANLQKQQVLLEPMVASKAPDQAKTLAQIDAVVNARAALERENAHMLFAIRETLTPDQWQKLKVLRWRHRMAQRGGPDGPMGWRHGQQGPGQPGAQPAPPQSPTPQAPQNQAPPPPDAQAPPPPQ